MHSSVPMLEGPVGVILLFALFAIMLIVSLLQKKSKPLTAQDAAAKLGIKYGHGHSDELLSKFSFINRMNYGKKKHIRDVFSGRYK